MDESRIPDVFYQRLIVMYRQRSRFWRNVSLCLLVLTFAFILAGVTLFYRGDSRSIAAKQEVDIQAQLKEVRQQSRTLSDEEAKLQSEFLTAKNAQMLAQHFTILFSTLSQMSERQGDESSIGDEIRDLLVLVSRVNVILENVNRLIKKSNSQDELQPVPLGDDGFKKQPPESFQMLMQADGSVDWSTALTSVSELLKQLQAIDLTNSDLKPAWTQILPTINRCLNNNPALAKLNLLEQTMAAAVNNIGSNLEVEQRAFLQRKAKGEELRRQEDDLNEQLEKISGDRNYILFMAWIPDLTIRVGAVILLLFITKILLATYRYTVSLSSYYLGIADAIQLLQPGPGQGAQWYKIEHLTALLGALVPTGLSIESVATPADNLTDLAKSWVARKP